ncbi:MAG: helix-turn-helix transcriptional regulator [Agarilytica sp.]
MAHSSHDKLHCSLSLALDIVGDYWTALILRDMMIFGGVRRFEQLREGLSISRNVLTDRLNKLVEQDILRKRPVDEGARRMEYKMSRKGWELVPVLLTMHQWSERWRDDPGNSALKFIDTETGEEIPPIVPRAEDGRLLGPHNVKPVPRNEHGKHYIESLGGIEPEKK